MLCDDETLIILLMMLGLIGSDSYNATDPNQLDGREHGTSGKHESIHTSSIII